MENGSINNNEFAISDLKNNIEQIFLNIIHLRPEELLVAPNSTHLTELKTAFNQLFKSFLCMDIIYTFNTDKTFFGVKVNPLISAQDAIAILTSDDPVTITKYQVEIDSKLFDVGLSAQELTALFIYEISSMMDPHTIEDVRALIDLHVISQDDIIQIRDSINYTQLIVFAIKDTMTKVSSVYYKGDSDMLTANKWSIDTDTVDALIAAQDKIINSVNGPGDSNITPQTVILKWMFMVYKDIQLNGRAIKETLRDAKSFTASTIEKQEIDKTITAIDRISTQTVIESASMKLTSLIESKGYSKIMEGSLFKNLKQSGLRSIEDDLYEFTIRAKAAETEEEAMYVLHGINNRIGILEDYVYNTPDIPEHEKKRWLALAAQYKQLRVWLSKQKIMNRKQYGLFFDYSQLDNIDA